MHLFLFAASIYLSYPSAQPSPATRSLAYTLSTYTSLKSDGPCALGGPRLGKKLTRGPGVAPSCLLSKRLTDPAYESSFN